MISTRNIFVTLAIVATVDQVYSQGIRTYSTPSAEVGLRLHGYFPSNATQYPFEYGFGHYYQGDILLAAEVGRVALKNEKFVIEHWPNAYVPYVIDGNFTESQRELLHKAFQQFEENTCVRFSRRKPEDEIFLTIHNGDFGCYSSVGRSRSNEGNVVNLQTPQCMHDVGVPVHELMHALGFFHEFTRPDRDEFIDINTSALLPEYQNHDFIESNFGKLDARDVTAYRVPYNYGSVMHYSRYAGAADNCCAVMSNKKPWNGEFGSLKGMQPGDIKQINSKYCIART